MLYERETLDILLRLSLPSLYRPTIFMFYHFFIRTGIFLKLFAVIFSTTCNFFFYLLVDRVQCAAFHSHTFSLSPSFMIYFRASRFCLIFSTLPEIDARLVSVCVCYMSIQFLLVYVSLKYEIQNIIKTKALETFSTIVNFILFYREIDSFYFYCECVCVCVRLHKSAY